MIEVSIVIVNFKVRKEIIDCIKSIEKNTKKISYEIIVVDNEGDNSLKNELKKYKQVKYILSKKNLGFGAGNNLGTRYAKGEYLFFLNPDTLVLDNAVENLYKFLTKQKKAGIVSPLLVNEKLIPFKFQGSPELTPTNIIFSQSFLRKFFPTKNIYNQDHSKAWNMKLSREADVVPGATMMISAKVFKKIGGFDENYFLYFEENDISKRLRSLGYKLYINPKSKIIHKVGQSTKNLMNIETIYKKSRFLYLKKHYGILKAILTEGILSINKFSVLILSVLTVSLFLRLYNLSISMPFIGDQGWFYLSARDLLIEGKIPLVGITSSHTWLHQGPLWTYMLSIPLLLFKFNPVSGAYLTAVLGVIATYLIYKVGTKMFSLRVGFIAAVIYAASPLIVFFDRMPFDPAPIPLFTILYFYTIFKWVKGEVSYFPWILFLIAVLYNLELATFSLFFPFFFLFLLALFKRKEYVRKLFNKKIIAYSVIGVIVPMLPVLIYDFSNGFKQTIIFLGWTVYKPFSFLIKHSSDNLIANSNTVISFILINIQKLIFQANLFLAVLVFLLSVLLLIYLIFRNKKIAVEDSKFLLFFLLVISLSGILLNQTPSDAYLPIIFPFVIFTTAIFLDYLMNKRGLRYITIIFICLMFLSNFYYSFKNSFKSDLMSRVVATDKIIALTNGKEYNLIGNGQGSQFKSFTMNYEFLLWWKGHPPVKKNAKLKIIIEETKTGIFVYKI